MTVARMTGLRIARVAVSERTTWLLVALELDNGVSGLGEATLDGSIDTVAQHLARLGRQGLEASATAADMFACLPDPQGDLALAAAVSALDHALNDCLARERRMSVANHLGGQRRSKIGLYANLNRRTVDRSPAGFAASARDALSAGFAHLKIAPFDEVFHDPRAEAPARALDKGLERVAAVRSAMGRDGRLMVDCHWRFTPSGAGDLIDACAGLDLHWIECPLPESAEFIPDIARLRGRANRKGMLLAGAENVVGLAGLEPFLEASAYDVLMPDVKYAGGLATMLRMAERLESAKVRFSPHNPSGPVAHAASVEVCSAAGTVDLLEYQFEESLLFDDLVVAPLARAGGEIELGRRLGLGVDLKDEILKGAGFVQELTVEESNVSGVV
ncbi:enolase C-terminal domain-like protein [Mesorhizobium sp. SP-1A]|uniref:enolase C-terminal domain-like protein n=1 Tax=Mesorhizobium sp. SP-1A TaxID=3077840 RepID=UPI0028F70289|nr:enolase C-terminal domain-like protein [Mesorhizobium sp. SP-1A]